MTDTNQHSDQVADQVKLTHNVYDLLVEEKRRRRELEEQLEATERERDRFREQWENRLGDYTAAANREGALQEQLEAAKKWSKDSIARAERRAKEADNDQDQRYWIGYKHALLDAEIMDSFPAKEHLRSKDQGAGGQFGESTPRAACSLETPSPAKGRPPEALLAENEALAKGEYDSRAWYASYQDSAPASEPKEDA